MEIVVMQNPKYIVHFEGIGFTASDENNPQGIRVKGRGYIIVDGERPAKTFDIPIEAIQRCKEVFMRECKCVRYQGDEPPVENFPIVRLGRAL